MKIINRILLAASVKIPIFEEINNIDLERDLENAAISMKVLGMFMNSFGYKRADVSLPEIEEVVNKESINEDISNEEVTIENLFVAFIQVEEIDQESDIRSRDKKLTNHIKWCARKNDTKRVVLHSFAHLAESKADATFAKELLDLVEKRLQNGGYEVSQTPYGYFLDLKMDAPGFSLARLWASL